ncbi:MAG: dehydrogenase [Acidobacteria bacterium]|nr:MAG: dehydrogenase [Acidobacteriota bacterium]
MASKTLWTGWVALACAASLTSGCRRGGGPPFTAAESLKTVRLDPGFRIEPFVTEPSIASPVAMEFDERGRIFVVEMPGYPLDTRPTGRIKLLEDRDHDGRYETATVFADNLVLPTGVMRWKRGILVTAAPDVWYFEDTKGDGRADVRKVVLTGFAFTNPQHTVNGPVYGLDNWVYLAHEGPAEAIVFKDKFGDQGRPLRFPEQGGGAPVDVIGHGVRFRPDRFEVEPLAGKSQFGHAFDDAGHYFTLDNSNHARHEVIAARYLKRNPDLLLRSAMQNVSDHGAAATVYAITKHAEFEMLSEPGQFTSACSLTFVPGGPLAAALGRSSLVAEPAQNLVHRDVWSPSGSTFVARRAQDGREFLAAADAWFRPVNFAAGPDGALYLVDYYRQLIEHPEWGVTHHHHDSPDLYRGSDRGRIYRITVESQGPFVAPARWPGDASAEELVAMLAHENLWWRRTAQRLLVDRQSPEAPAMLLRFLRESPSPLGRLHALWTLEGLGKLEPAVVLPALGDADPRVRENAIRLAEPFLAGDKRLVERLLAMAGDPDPRVRFQLLCTLGDLDSPAGRAARDRILFADIQDEWVQAAALSASSDQAVAYLDHALAPGTGLVAQEGPGRAVFLRQAAGVVGARRRPAEIGRLVERAAAPGPEWSRAALLQGVAVGLRRTHSEPAVLAGVRPRLLSMAEGPSAPIRHAALELLAQAGPAEGPAVRAMVARAAARAADRTQDPAARADVARLEALVDPQEPEPVQAAAVKALAKAPGDAVGTFLIARWKTLTPTTRTEAARVLLADPGRTRLLLAALKDRSVPAWTLSFGHKRDLLMNEDADVRTEAHALLEEKAGEREQVLKRYEAALDRPADAARGEQVFRNVCAKCHRFQGYGSEVGPDLGTVRNRAASLLLKDILIRTEEGVLAGQTPTTIVLHREGGQETVIPRGDVRRMYVSQLSAMPADLEQQVSEQQMADLLEYLTKVR